MADPTISQSDSTTQAQSHYSSRASNYDHSNGGWHIKLGQQFADWLSPIPAGGIALDLACGTGLVTIPLARAIGRGGTVIGVDITADMLDQARQKDVPKEAAKIVWIEHDITNLDDTKEVQAVLEDRGGFDVISCCSALVLLPSPTEAIKLWAKLLKPGGRMIIDVPTEDETLQYIISSNPRLRIALGLPSGFDRSWIESTKSLEALYRDAGLTVKKSWRTESYLPETVYERDEGENVWEEQAKKYRDFIQVNEAKEREAREIFLEEWRGRLLEGDRFTDGHWLYVSMASK